MIVSEEDIDLLQQLFTVIKTSKHLKVLFDHCSLCKENKSRTVSDNTIAAERLSDVFISIDKKGTNASKNVAKNISRTPGRALEIGPNVGTAFASISPTAVLSSLPEIIIFCHTGQ